jgi:hypothetical protein
MFWDSMWDCVELTVGNCPFVKIKCQVIVIYIACLDSTFLNKNCGFCCCLVGKTA